jgi:tripartite ATP-independent transporter DctP family solute receptor
MMLKKTRCLVLAMVLVLVVVSCTTFAAVKPIKLIFGTVMNPDHFITKGDLYFKQLVEKNSKGRILIDFFPACQLGSGPELIQAIKSGAQHLGLVGGGSLTPLWPAMGTLDLPYMYRDEEHSIKVAKRLASIINQRKFAAKTGMHILSVRVRTARQLTTKFPVNKVEDIKGIKVRVPETPVQMALWKALGAIPTALPIGDTYTALATGTLDAQENPFADIYAWKFYEVVKYCALTGHMRELTIMVVNDKYWKGLTNSQKKIINDAAAKSEEKGNKDAREDDQKHYKLLADAGMKFTKPDLASFMEKAKTIWGQFGDEELIKKIQAIK